MNAPLSGRFKCSGIFSGYSESFTCLLFYENKRRLQLIWGQGNLPAEPGMEEWGRLAGTDEHCCGLCALIKVWLRT